MTTHENRSLSNNKLDEKKIFHMRNCKSDLKLFFFLHNLNVLYVLSHGSYPSTLGTERQSWSQSNSSTRYSMIQVNSRLLTFIITNTSFSQNQNNSIMPSIKVDKTFQQPENTATRMYGEVKYIRKWTKNKWIN